MKSDKARMAISKSLKGNEKLKEAMRKVHANRLMSGEDAKIREKIKQTRIANGDWTEKDNTKWLQYCKDVRNVTSKQPINQLPFYEHRGRGTGKYHLDHIVSKKVGFIIGLPPGFIGDISNLRFIPESENCAKQHFSSEEDILNLWFNLTESFEI